MRHTQDFLALIDLVTRVRASGLPEDIAEAAIAAGLEEYSVRHQDPRLHEAARLFAVAPEKVPHAEEAPAGGAKEEARPSAKVDAPSEAGAKGKLQRPPPRSKGA